MTKRKCAVFVSQPNYFRAIEDRLPNILAFLESKETDATDLAKAKENALRKSKPQAVYLEADLERDLTVGESDRVELTVRLTKPLQPAPLTDRPHSWDY